MENFEANVEMDVSRIFNSTGAYAELISVMRDKYDIDLDDHDEFFLNLEETVVYMLKQLKD